MGDTLIIVGGTAVTYGHALGLLAAAAFAVLIRLAVVQARARRAREEDAAAAAGRSDEIEDRVEALTRIQAETVGGLRAMNDTLSGRQAELAKVVSESLQSLTHRLDQSITTTTEQTGEKLRVLHERLAVIDSAQKNLAELSTQVTSLREVLGNKQSRGAFGQGRMEAIVQDGLPKDSYAFQHTLKNGKRPDCVVFLPGDPCPLVIDAKFPLEAITALREAKSEHAREQAAQRVRHDVHKHVKDIAERYLVPGETQDLALMFVPSESVYADLYDGFDEVIQKAYRSQVVLVSPSLLMLAIQVMQQICKDARMRDAAAEIRNEVGRLMDDIGRLHDRVLKLQQHFGKANEDVALILTSAEKVMKRGDRIEALEFDGEEAPREARLVIPSPLRKVAAAE